MVVEVEEYLERRRTVKFSFLSYEFFESTTYFLLQMGSTEIKKQIENRLF